MINLGKVFKNIEGQTVVVVLLYIMIVSVLVSSLVIISLNTAEIQTTDSKYLSAKLLAKSKIDQILGAEDDLFVNSELEANRYLSKIKSNNSNEVIEANSSISKSSDSVESLGNIVFKNAGQEGNSRVECTRTANSQIERFYLPPYKSLQINVNNSSFVNLAYTKTDILLFTAYIQVSSSIPRYTSVEFGIDTNASSGSNGNVLASNGGFIYPTAKNNGLTLNNFLYKGLQNLSISSNDQDVVSVDISSLIANINQSSILYAGESVGSVIALEVTNISDRDEDAELALWGNQIPSNIIKLSCKSELGYYEESGTQATYIQSIYYPSALITPNFLKYAIAIGKFADKDGNENYVLAK